MKHFSAEAGDEVVPWHATAQRVAQTLAETAVKRDQRGGTPKAERDLLRDSGLLMLSVPTELGGLGASWQQTLDVVRGFARVDSSVAHLFAFHHLLLATTQLFAQRAQWQPWIEQTRGQRWFWGNALNPLDKSTRAEAVDGGYVFSGRKSFCSGASDSDMLLASALDANDRLLIGVVPTQRTGITVLDDWDNMGQRQTDSGSVLFDNVRVDAGELLLDPGPLSTPFACLRPLLAQLILANIYLGLGEGALEEAKAFTLQQGRPWLFSTASTANEDPYVLTHYGDFWLALQGARMLLDQAAAAFDQAWLRGTSLDEQERGQVAVAVAAAKVASTRASLEVAHRMFEVTGARATTAALRLDRYWRNLRVHTLHDPVDYKVRELGDWALNSRLPQPSFYS
ncbi:alkylation response protein AidB-like acyl-CoA dehydrogenase [Variovorax boronicumulans]|uniref:acyl-CoA dehydrogenase family protein n=1 Tax=Variovorax boronicumulans TaxID=436515 RepID=UPI0027833D7E|nr:acyl-CoA dehydrogenase family protein [Variovorax boronicumulans]MDP9993342.1 alkylation response protein AidB-like acyl-CoA dehydrogenase [Variovorax boronicumulans]MDQ0004791.1 alkylation response protein AidB-like acyl-CoA dehydrogenase [Variovorax boronicumulans]